MSDKIITDLPLISGITDAVNVPVHDTIQTYRSTVAQIKDHLVGAQKILLPSLKDDIFTGLTAVDPVDQDFGVIADTSDSGRTKKVLLSNFRRASQRQVNPSVSGGSVLDTDATLIIVGNSGNLTLPANGNIGKKYKFINAYSGSGTKDYSILTTGGALVGGLASGVFVLRTAGEMLEVEDDGTNWVVVGRHAQTDWAIATILGGGAPNGDIIGTGGTNPSAATTTVVKRLMWRRSGCMQQVRWEYLHTVAAGSAVGTGIYKFKNPRSFPGGGATFAVIDVTKVTPYTGASAFAVPSYVGSGRVTAAAAIAQVGVYVYDDTYVCLVGLDATLYGQVGASFYPMNGATAGYAFQYEVPIVGWQP